MKVSRLDGQAVPKLSTGYPHVSHRPLTHRSGVPAPLPIGQGAFFCSPYPGFVWLDAVLGSFRKFLRSAAAQRPGRHFGISIRLSGAVQGSGLGIAFAKRTHFDTPAHP